MVGMLVASTPFGAQPLMKRNYRICPLGMHCDDCKTARSPRRGNVRFCWFLEGCGVPAAAWGGGVRDPVSLLAVLSGKPPPANGGGRV